MPELSIIVTTARDDEAPYAGRPDLHLWEPLALTLAAQGVAPDRFELIIVDAHWEQHADWFGAHPQPYAVKHVPASPNVWHPVGRSGACAQLNRGLAWAEGEVAFFCHENTMFPPHFVGLLLELCHRGTIPLCTYVEDFGFDQERNLDNCKVSPLPYELLGYTGARVHEDSRLSAVLGFPSPLRVPWEWYFTYSAMPLELAFHINGWNECMDGVGALVDCDVGSRIQLAGFGDTLVMHRDLWCVRPAPKCGHWSQAIKGEKIPGRCNYALLLWARHHHEPRAGAVAHAVDGLLDEMEHDICGGVCPLSEKCRRREIPDEFGFIRDPAVYVQWRERTHDYDLAAQAELRRRGVVPFDRGYCHVPA